MTKVILIQIALFACIADEQEWKFWSEKCEPESNIFEFSIRYRILF